MDIDQSGEIEFEEFFVWFTKDARELQKASQTRTSALKVRRAVKTFLLPQSRGFSLKKQIDKKGDAVITSAGLSVIPIVSSSNELDTAPGRAAPGQ